MDPNPQRPKHQDNPPPSLNVTSEVTNLAEEISSPTPAKAVFGSVGVILTAIKVRLSSPPVVYSQFTCNQDSVANKPDCVDLGMTCVNVRKALHRRMDGKELDDLSQSMYGAIQWLTTWVKPAVHGSDGSLMMFLIVEPRADRGEDHRERLTVFGLQTALGRPIQKQLISHKKTTV